MATYQNIEEANKRQFSKYPFDPSSTLKLDIYTFPVAWIKSLSVVVGKCVFPLYINKIYIEQKAVCLDIVDWQGTFISKIVIQAESAYIQNKAHCIGGAVYTDPALYSWLFDIIKTNFYNGLQLVSSSLILSDTVITCCYYDFFSGLSVNGVYAGNDVHINFQRNTEYAGNPEELPNYGLDIAQQQGPAFKGTGMPVRINVLGDYAYTYENKTKLKYVNGVDLANKTLIIKSRPLADLRVQTTQGKISLTGVTDAT